MKPGNDVLKVGDKVIFAYKSPGMDVILKEEVQPPSIGIILHLFEIRGEKLAVVDWHESHPRPHPLPPITCRPVSMLKLTKKDIWELRLQLFSQIAIKK